MFFFYRTFLPLTFFIFCSTLPLYADVTVSPIFSDHMVLQKASKVPIWGNAEPGEKVTVSLNGLSAGATTTYDKQWKVVLNLEDFGPGPFEMVIQGKNQIHIEDVLIGQVWLASGQSNMTLQMQSTSIEPDFFAKSKNPMLREFTVERTACLEPSDTYKGRWNVAGPNTTAYFSAVAYYFGLTLQRELNVPIGIVHASWGGTPCEAWIRQQAIDQIPGIAERRAEQLKDLTEFPAKKEAFVATLASWLKTNNREDMSSNVEKTLNSTDNWKSLRLPDDLQTQIATPGVVWLRQKVDVPAENVGRSISIEMDLHDTYETIYWNGKEIDRITPSMFPLSKHDHSIPASDVRVGENDLAIRLYSPIRAPRMKVAPMILKKQNSAGWQIAVEKIFPTLTDEMEKSVPVSLPKPTEPSNIASMLYNGMIHPLLPFAIRGVIWYQGESNTLRAAQYATTFPLMIEDWRTQWSQGSFPFYFCQLASNHAKMPNPVESSWAELRESQSKALNLPNTGEAVLVDIGEANNIHPRNKRDVGERLAKIALAKDYGRDIAYSGPVFKSLEIRDGKVSLKFDHTDGGLVARPLPATYDLNSEKSETAPTVRNSPDSELEGFAICGADQKWTWANAEIRSGDTVVVWSDKVPEPVAVRYGWADNPTSNLFNGAGLPASPFRTDHFPGITKDAKY